MSDIYHNPCSNSLYVRLLGSLQGSLGTHEHMAGYKIVFEQKHKQNERYFLL